MRPKTTSRAGCSPSARALRAGLLSLCALSSPSLLVAGACCNPATVSGCVDTGGICSGDRWMGTYSSCSETPRPCDASGMPAVGRGSCCILGGCDSGTETGCVAAGGDYAGDDTLCADAVCERGACCSSLGCTNTTDSDCVGIFSGVGSACDDMPDPCLSPCDARLIRPLRELQVVKATPGSGDLELSWMEDTGAAAYNVWAVTRKTDIPMASMAGSPAPAMSVLGCRLVIASRCTHEDAVTGPPGSIRHYNALGACSDGREAPE